ncbi:L-type lectin family protein [Levilactobacillus tujiorum]|uniref:hypothetical protein n=1 Tax=Levilactobacillus tujiorum TaxID=2912243 RepID=UPI0014567BE6|nr:hypothetical protein [Levilactobacillus tujiorum]NLR31808.1 hypothetical protein [Levilactobacillus tujiorum]
MKTVKKGLLSVVTALTVVGLGLWEGGDLASAKSTVFNTGAKALEGAPQGIYLGSGTNSDYFTIDNTVSTASGTNAASLVDAGSPAGTNNSAIQISKAGEMDSWGSIWSKQQSFDLNKPETASMWIYASGENTADVGDGMAFVLQNGGTDVYSGPGESMGVWGVPDSLFAKTDVASTAIQNSWALEFDTYANGKGGIPTQPRYSLIDPLHLSPIPTWDFSDQNPSTFDVNGDTASTQTAIDDTHIASNYPGDSGTYTETSDYANGNKKLNYSVQPWVGNYYYYTMKHEGFLDEGATGSGNLSDHRWHHITIDYTPPTTVGGEGSMTYTYNDKDPDTGLPIDSNDYATVPIDLSKFNLSSGQSKVRWGFTGSTGKAASENNLVVFDQLPGQAQTEASAKLEAQDGGDYTEVKDGDAVSGGKAVKLTYTFGRTDGDEDWKSVNANLTIPSGLDITSGTIDYPDASYKDSNDNKVDLSKLTTSSDGSSQSLPVSLAGDGLTMSGTQHATITLTGTAKNIATDSTGVSQNAETSYFTGSNATSSAKTPNFTITPKVNDKLAMDVAKDYGVLKVNYGGSDQAVVTGTAISSEDTVNSAGVRIPASEITIHPSINGVSQDPVKESDIHSTNPLFYASQYYFDYKIDNDKLQPGDNTISFYATCDSTSGKLTSTTVNATVTAGTVGFGHTSGNITFEPTLLTGNGQSQVINRADDWSLDVDDSLTKDSPWQVTAKTAGMFADTDNVAVNTPLDGSLIYTDAAGNETTLNDSDSPVIASGTSTGEDTSTNIAADWKDDTGIRLRINGNAVEGNYEGTIDWSFVNSVSTS